MNREDISKVIERKGENKIMDIVNEIIEKLGKASKIAVVGHIMPDGDCISSVLSLSIGLEKLGKFAMPMIDYNVPWFYREFEGTEKIKDFEGGKKFLEESELLVILDSSSPDRIGRVKEYMERKFTIVMDHHATNSKFGDLNWVDSNYSSVAEMVFILNRMMNVNYDPLLATLNLMGMATDTGFFKYSNVSADLFRKVADLIELGADLNFIARTILENKKVEQLRLFSHVLNQMKFRANNRLVYSIVRFEDFERYNCTEEDSSGFVNELRSIRGVEVAILFVEYPKGRIHASMRSKSYYDLTKVASEFNGGGHPRAAGATFDDENMERVVRKIVGRIERDLTN